MWKNYFIIALRNFRRSWGFALMNVGGLGIGLASVLLIYLYVHYEKGYDKYLDHSDRIYRLINIGKEYNDPIIQGVFFPLQREEVAGVEAMTMMRKLDVVVRIGEKKLGGQQMLLADSCLFEVFGWRALSGNPAAALRGTNAVVLTRSAAEKYFGSTDAVGMEMILANFYRAVVTAVIEDLPAQSFVHFDLIVPPDFMQLYSPGAFTDWGNSSFQFFYLLAPRVHPEDVERSIAESWDRHAPSSRGKNIPRMLQPLEEIHLHSENVRWDMEPQGSITTLRILSITAILILVLAVINFVNLSTARNSKRFREIGLRKVLGSTRKWVILQFMAETSVYIAMAVLLAIVMAELALPWFNGMAGISLDISAIFEPVTLLTVLAFLVLLTFLAGSYPAFVLSGFRPADALRSKGAEVRKTSKKWFTLREALVVLQFMIAMGLFTGTFIVQRQFSFLTRFSPGFEKEQKLVVENAYSRDMNVYFDAFRQELSKMPQVRAQTASHNIPGRFQNNYNGMYVKGTDEKLDRMTAAIISVENNFFEVMGARILEGEGFPLSLSEAAKDSLPYCVINETLATIMRNKGIEQPIGETLVGFWDVMEERKIIGVVNNIHFRSLNNKVYPAVFLVSKTVYPNYVMNFIIDLDTRDLSATMEEMEVLWDRIAPEWPLKAHFLDHDFMELYAREKNLGEVMRVFTALALLMSLLSVLAMVMFSMQGKIREIGIRKVLGAEMTTLLPRLTWHFLKLVLLADLLVLPMIWYLSLRWLEQFAYRITFDWWIFAVAVLFSVLFTLAVILYHTYRAARANPAEVLKYE